MPTPTGALLGESYQIPEEEGVVADARSRETYPALIRRLSHQSVVKHFDAYADIDWDAPEMQIDPADPRWELSDEEAARLREYLDRGGFMMVDAFHGGEEWAGFVASMQRVFPDRPIVEIPDDDEVKHVLYDLDAHIQIPGIAALRYGVTYEQDGVEPHWRGIYDDAGRLMVAINFNMDLGDAWEHANDAFYPEPMTGLATRFAVNYVIYAMTH